MNRPSFVIGGVRLDLVPNQEVPRLVARWCVSAGLPHIVVFVNAYRIVTAGRDPHFLEALNSSDLSISDGSPVAWVASRLSGVRCDRLGSQDFMHTLLTDPACAHLTHFIYGGSQEALDRIAFRYNRGGMVQPRRIVGTCSPPARDLTSKEEEDLIQRLHTLRPDILWVCLETARQEKWMAAMRSRLPVRVMAGVESAVDLLSGQKPRTPRWMRAWGIEWSFRLMVEPRRLWKRDLIGNALFLRLVLRELWRHRQTRRQQA
jgi:N-acetylglucosaminyldiphosphoundecaprenol N-acetyl-beta-D-mannosaminyltransferase